MNYVILPEKISILHILIINNMVEIFNKAEDITFSFPIDGNNTSCLAHAYNNEAYETVDYLLN